MRPSPEHIFPDPAVAKLARAACRGDVRGIRQSIAAGVDVNAVGSDGLSPLIWALGCENLAGVQALLDGGADANLGAAKGLNPMVVAAALDDVRFLEVLYAAGASPEGDAAYQDSSPLLRARALGIHKGNWDNYRYLISVGANINAIYGPRPGLTIAEALVATNRYDMVVELMNMGYSTRLDHLRLISDMGFPDPEQEKHKKNLFEIIDNILRNRQR